MSTRGHQPGSDVVCWSHLRWHEGLQRPQQLMARFAQGRRVFFIEEPIDDDVSRLVARKEGGGVVVVEVHLARGLGAQDRTAEAKGLIELLYAQEHIEAPIAWHTSPLLYEIARELPAVVVVYDAGPVLSAPPTSPELSELEGELLTDADVVFASDSLDVAGRQHGNLYALPSAEVDARSEWDQLFVEVRRIIDAALSAEPLRRLLDSLGA